MSSVPTLSAVSVLVRQRDLLYLLLHRFSHAAIWHSGIIPGQVIQNPLISNFLYGQTGHVADVPGCPLTDTLLYMAQPPVPAVTEAEEDLTRPELSVPTHSAKSTFFLARDDMLNTVQSALKELPPTLLWPDEPTRIAEAGLLHVHGPRSFASEQLIAVFVLSETQSLSDLFTPIPVFSSNQSASRSPRQIL